MLKKYFDWIDYGEIQSEDEVFNKINNLNPKGEAWQAPSGLLFSGKYRGEQNIEAGTAWGLINIMIILMNLIEKTHQ